VQRECRKIQIFDTTLRDGEQSPGASMTVEEKVRLAFQLKKLGVDVIEAGFPISSNGDFNAVMEIAKQVKGPTICALARAVDKDIESAAKALTYAEHKRIHVFIATSEIHMKYKLKMNPTQVILKAVAAVKKARCYVDEVEFSAEDAARSDIDFLVQVLNAVIEAGATTVNIPDTVGYTTPEEFGFLIAQIKRRVKNINSVILSVHCHNDLGLATANSLAAIKSGAEQVECTVNGIGERAGNCALEEIVMALKTRQDIYQLKTGVDSRELVKSSNMVKQVTSMKVQPNKAIVGANAFSHEAGIHQHGVLAHPATYEIMRAEDVGFSSNAIVLGKHCGRHSIRRWLSQRKINLIESDIDILSIKIKSLSDKKKRIEDDDVFEMLAQIEKLHSVESNFNKVSATKC